ncbi:restriction endonuclease-like protein [Marinomonas sp. C2222]|uniref:Restriction endonuclease-like protein n=1 Tax=Marinomonas sargassi TaxID=2984494 RepID=A0ABT2YQE0_9GAMM|nr:restriction endonuclease-like protein [Marinomonas sargassi]MCV2402102.1 restriction endonuclease-like protein [Marinomonas sargassi]
MAKNTEVLSGEHDDFDIHVSTSNLASLRETLRKTYSSRSIDLPKYEEMIAWVGSQLMLPSLDIIGPPHIQPFFFENRQYWFEIEFKDNVDKGSFSVNHKYALLDQSFSPHPRRNALHAAINFGNDVGLCRFEIQYSINGIQQFVPVSFTVFATKMVQALDLSIMNQKIDSIYPLWRYAISGKTTHFQGKSTRQSEKFELFWLAQFERLVAEFNQGIKRVLNAPHNRLQTYTYQQKLERVNKRLGVKQEQKAKELIASKRPSRLVTEKQRLNLDTPENRFIKMVLTKTKANLSKMLVAIRAEKDSKASDSFFETLEVWCNQIGKYAKHQLWQEVGEFKGQNTESKVLQEAAGYSKVYKVWQQLKYYLNGKNGESQLSIKSVADIYEIWCFLEVKSIIESLGFIQQNQSLGNLKQVQFEKQLPEDEMAAAFVYQHESDQMKIELAHEPRFNPNGHINRTYLIKQRPDIVLRATLKSGESFLILFDAKYRIDTTQFGGKDAVPEDAINQMHRYRDAIIHQQRFEYEVPLKSRPVLGAFALYPGFFSDQKSERNPYCEAINEIGIGAFALLPSEGDQGFHNHWLKEYLIQKLGKTKQALEYSKAPSHDYHFVEDAARIAPYGVNVSRHYGLTFIAPVNELDRDQEYLDKAKTGNLKGYHTKLIATNRQNIHRNIVREIRYVVVTVRDSTSNYEQLGKYLYPVSKVKLLPRQEVHRDITGKESDSNELYWVFEFSGRPTLLDSVIKKPYIEEHFSFKLIKAEHLPEIAHWNGIQSDLALYEGFSTTW